MHRKPSIKQTWTLGRGFALLLASLLAATVVTANDWYVKPGGDDGAAGDSWADAWASIQFALDEAKSGDTIHLAGQTFALTNQLVWTNAGITVRGGYEADPGGASPGNRNPDQWTTVLTRSGVANHRILHINGANNSTLEHVTLTGGRGWGNPSIGIGLYISGGSTNVVLSGCRIYDNRSTGSQTSGAGIKATSDTEVTLINCVVRDNSISDTGGGGTRYTRGGGITSRGTMTIRDSQIIDNLALAGRNPPRTRGQGGGIWVGSGTLTMENVVLARNDASDGPGDGIYVTGASTQADMKNMLFSDQFGNAIYVHSGTLNVINATLVDNRGEGIVVAGGSVTATNSIAWRNMGADLVGVIDIAYSNIEDGAPAGENNISDDPLFEYGYYLADTSPSAGTGSGTAVSLGLDEKARNAAGDTYGPTDIVNMGWHYPAGFDFDVADLFVAPDGDDVENTGEETSPFASLAHALSLARDGTRIHVATGTYTEVSGEVFPLTIDRKLGVRILGTNAAATVFDAESVTGKRVMHLVHAHDALIEGITLTRGRTYEGGGLRIDNSHRVTISDCMIVSNTWRDGIWQIQPPGAGMYATDDTSVTLTNCIVRGNIGESTAGRTTHARGGGIYSSGHLSIYESVIKDNQAYQSASDNGGQGGGLYFAGGQLHMRNVLVAGNYAMDSGDGLYLASGSAVLENVTVADNNTEGILMTDAEVAVSNSILFGNAFDLMGFPEDSEGNLPTVWYSLIGGGQNAGVQGCISLDPLFADTVHYHLQSTEGHYTNGYFSGGSWTTAAANSPAIDRGDPSADYSREPEPNGERINMGAYGNTPVAAKTPVIEADPPVIVNLGAQTVGHRTVTLRAEVTDTGGDTPETWFAFWQDGTAVTNTVPRGLQSGPFDAEVAGLVQGATYHYRAYAENAEDMAVSAVETFTLHTADADLYVSANGNHTTGADWETAYTDLETALAIAEPGDTVHLAGQTFMEAPLDTRGFPSEHPYQTVFLWQNATNITIIGGYQALPGQTPGTPDPSQWETVFTRTEGHARILTVLASSNCVIENVTIRDGYFATTAPPTGGAGMLLEDSSAIQLKGCRITANEMYRQHGGGLFLNLSTLTLTDSIIDNNIIAFWGQVNGSGAYIGEGSHLTAIRSLVASNRYTSGNSSAYGGGFYVDQGGTLDVLDTVFHANQLLFGRNNRGYGAAIANNGGTAWIRNALMTDNQTHFEDGGAVWSGGENAVTILESSTIVGNGDEQVGLLYGGDGIFAVTNTIVWNHTVADLDAFPIDGDGHLRDVSHSLFALPDLMDGIRNCTTDDPLFIDPPHDYRLQRGSPAIDTGINQPWMTGQTDLSGTLPRIMQGIVDMGCYETIPPRGTVILLR